MGVYDQKYECDGQYNLLDYLKELEEEPAMPVDIRGLMDNPYCPKCKHPIGELDEFKERCVDCGQKLDWTRYRKILDIE